MDDLIKRLERADEYEPLGHDAWEAAAALAEAQAEVARLREAIQAILDDVGYNVEDLGDHAKEKLVAAL